MADYNLFPGMDSSYRFPPAVRTARSNYPEFSKFLGGSGFKGTLPNTTDLDSVQDEGIYGFWSASANTPSEHSGILIVSKVSTNISQLAWEYNNSGPKIYARIRGAYWGPWNEMGGGGGSDPIQAPTGFDANNVDANQTHVVSATAQAKNLPPGVTACRLDTVVLIPSGFRPKQQTALSTGANPSLWTRFSGSGGWSAWSILADGTDNPTNTISEVPNQSRVSLKTVPLALTVGGGINNFETTQGGVRIPFKFSVPISRWRVHFRNINPRQGESSVSSVGIPYVVYGDAGPEGYTYKSVIEIADGLSGTGDMVTPWQSTILKENTEYILGYTWISDASPKKVVGGGWTTEYGGSAFRSNAATATPTVSMPLDCWIEAEVSSSTPVVAAFGDSLSSGVGATRPVYDSWLSQWCRENGALPVHYTASGDTMAGWSDKNHYKWQRWQGLTRPDAVIHAMGSNDVFGGATLAQMKERRDNTIQILKELVSPVIFTGTILPRSGITGATEDVRRSYNAWLKKTPDAARDWFDFVTPVSADDENLSSAVTSDNVHLTTVGYKDVSRSIGRAVFDRESTHIVSETINLDTLTYPCTFTNTFDNAASVDRGYPPEVKHSGWGEVVVRGSRYLNNYIMFYHPRIGPSIRREYYNGQWYDWKGFDGKSISST